MKNLSCFLILLSLSACQPPAQLPPQYGATTTTSNCHQESSDIHFSVYSNVRDQDFHYPSVALDKSQAIPQPVLEVNGQIVKNVSGNRVSIKRQQGPMKLEFKTNGYHSLSVNYEPNAFSHGPCENNYVALSPLSAEESQGELQKSKVLIMDKTLTLNQDQSSGLEYAVVQDLKTFETIAEQLVYSPYPPDKDKQWLEDLRNQIKAGKALALISNGSEGMGDLFDLVHRVTKLGNKTILASHLGTLQQDPKEPGPFGDRFRRQLEAVLIPGDTQILVLDLLQRGAGGGHKKRVEIAVSKAGLPEQTNTQAK